MMIVIVMNKKYKTYNILVRIIQTGYSDKWF